MGKWGNESAALVGFEITVPAPAPDEGEQASDHAPDGGYEDTWYRTLRVMSGSPQADGIERTGALGEGPRPHAQPNAQAEAPAQPLAQSAANAPRPATEGEAGYVAPQKSADSYEDSWYQILRSRQAAAGD